MKISRIGGLLFVLCLLAGPAAAEKLAFEGELDILFTFANDGGVATGTGIATVNGSSSTGHLNTLALNTRFAVLNTVLPVTDPIVTAGGIVAIFLTDVQVAPDLQGGTFRPISGAVQSTTALSPLARTMPQTGFARICIFDPLCGASLDLELGGTVNGVVVGAGVGGVLTIGGAGGIRISILGAPWTVKTVSVSNRNDTAQITTFTRHGFAHGPSSGTSSTALTSGVIQLVTAQQVEIIGVPGNSDRSGVLTHVRLHFIPEPGLLLLLGSGAVGLAVLGRRRSRR